jgi:hypothetical protein
MIVPPDSMVKLGEGAYRELGIQLCDGVTKQ